MATNVSTDRALQEARALRASTLAFVAAKRLYESGLPLKKGCAAIHLDETTVRKWAVEHGWKRGAPP